ncbi:MFS transporter [Actinophytocola sp.]|uniref:MFS transporter n=1 Tax=Actinophytocola sp. TaxID=1872138 RepID=UPI0025BB8AC3|nr:MFS transporter [Actinophytocola sp.]
MPVTWWLGQLTMAHLVGAALVISLANVVFDIGSATFLPSIVSRAELTARNSLVSATYSTTQLGGPSLGGLVVQLLGAVPTLLVDAVSFVASAVLLRGLPPGAAAPAEDRPRMTTLIREGWRFVVRHPVMRPCMFGATAINFANGALMALIPVFLVRDLLASPRAGRPPDRRRRGRCAAWCHARGTHDRAAGQRPRGPGGRVRWRLLHVAHAGRLGRARDGRVRGRQHRLRQRGRRVQHRDPHAPAGGEPTGAAVPGDGDRAVVSWGAIPFGALAAGAVAEAVGTRQALWVTCVLTLAGPVLLWFSPVRHLRQLAEELAPGRTG